MTLARRLWGGEVPLVEAFWYYAIGCGLIINLVTGALFMALLMNNAPVAVLVLFFALPIPYNVLFAVGVWRSAENYEGSEEWASLARIVVVVWAVALSVA